MKVRVTGKKTEILAFEVACIYQVSDFDDESDLVDECNKIARARGYIPYSLCKDKEDRWTAKFNTESVRDMTLGELMAWHYLEMDGICSKRPCTCEDCPYDGRLPAESCNDFRKEDDK